MRLRASLDVAAVSEGGQAPSLLTTGAAVDNKSTIYVVCDLTNAIFKIKRK